MTCGPRVVPFIMCAVLLSACAKHAPLPSPEPPMPPAVEEPSPEPPPPPPKPSKPKPPPVAEQPRPAPPSDFTGLSKADVTALLGEAPEQEERNPGQVWIYRAGSCTAELLFLLDIVRNDRFVAEWHIAGTDGTPAAQQRCLQRIGKRYGK